MKSFLTRVFLLLAAAGICLFSILKTQGRVEEPVLEVQHSTTGYGPSILLLHDSSKADLDWASKAKELATRFEVTLVDISKIINDSEGVQQLRKAIRELEIDDSHIAGSANGAGLAERYARSYPYQSDHFVLPQNSEDLEILADIVNSTPFTKS